MCQLHDFRCSAKTHLLNHHIERSGLHLSCLNGTIEMPWITVNEMKNEYVIDA